MENKMTAQVSQGKVASDGLVGMIFLLASEGMFFAGLISAYIVNRAGAMEWPPANQPRLPIEVTAVNTFILLLSGFFIVRFRMNNRNSQTEAIKSKGLIKLSLLLGLIFLIVQGSEWVRLLHFGLTTRSSLYGAFFYTIIGAHGLHVFAGLLTLLYLSNKLKKQVGFNMKSIIDSCSIYWLFVVVIWPVLYYLVYLS